MKKTLIFVCLFSMVYNVFAQNKLKTTALNIFKNGTYYVVKEGTVKLKDRSAKIEIPKSPLQSTFWLTTTKDNFINRVVFMNDTIKLSKPISNYFQLLSSNKGKKVNIFNKIDDKNIIETSGTLVDFDQYSNFVKLLNENKQYEYFYLNDTKKILIENPVEKIKIDSLAYLANIEFQKNQESVPLKMIYMQSGIQWIPSYNIKILNDKELQLEMYALVENFAEIVENADLTLTVGNPNFKFGGNIEPFANPNLSPIYSYGQNQYQTYYFQNSRMPAAQAMYDNYSVEESANNVNYNDYRQYTTEGEKSNDLYFFKLGKVSIPKNSKASFQIFSQKNSYKDVYSVSIGDVVNYINTRYISNNPEQKYSVFHSLKIENSTKNPFTSAPVFVLDENLQPLAQDEIRYTPVGNNVSVQLSDANDVIVKNTEEEIKVVEKAKTQGKSVYNKITLKGTIDVGNYQDKKITLNLTKFVNGEVLETTFNGKIKKQGKYSGFNPSTEINWEIPIEAFDKISINYTYEVYILMR